MHWQLLFQVPSVNIRTRFLSFRGFIDPTVSGTDQDDLHQEWKSVGQLSWFPLQASWMAFSYFVFAEEEIGTF